MLLLSALLFYAKIKGDRIHKKREDERIAKECAEYVKGAEEQERSKNAGTRLA